VAVRGLVGAVDTKAVELSRAAALEIAMPDVMCALTEPDLQGFAPAFGLLE